MQTDKTKGSMLEVKKELAAIIGGRPGTQAELDQSKAFETLTLSGRWETNNAVLASLAQIARYGLSEDYGTSYAGKVRALRTDDVNQAARTLIDPTRAVWIVVGDRAKSEQGVRDAAISEVIVIDAHPLTAKP